MKSIVNRRRVAAPSNSLKLPKRCQERAGVAAFDARHQESPSVEAFFIRLDSLADSRKPAKHGFAFCSSDTNDECRHCKDDGLLWSSLDVLRSFRHAMVVPSESVQAWEQRKVMEPVVATSQRLLQKPRNAANRGGQSFKESAGLNRRNKSSPLFMPRRRKMSKRIF